MFDVYEGIMLLALGFIAGAWLRNYFQDEWDDDRAKHIEAQDVHISRLEKELGKAQDDLVEARYDSWTRMAREDEQWN